MVNIVKSREKIRLNLGLILRHVTGKFLEIRDDILHKLNLGLI